MKTRLNIVLVIMYICRAIAFFLFSFVLICLIYFWHSDALTWQQTEKIWHSYCWHSDTLTWLQVERRGVLYSMLFLGEILAFIGMIKEKMLNRLLYIKEIVEIAVVIFLLLIHVHGSIIQTAIGLYTEATACTLFCLVNIGMIFIPKYKRDASRL